MKKSILALVVVSASVLSVNMGAQAQEVGTKASISAALKKIAAALKAKGVSKIPSTSTLVSTSTKTSSSTHVNAVSGIPPTILDIQKLDVKTLFWQPGVVQSIASRSAGPLQCRQFFQSDVDGDSGGLGACHMTEGLGHAFEDLTNSERSLCFLKNLPTQANLDAGGIVLESGSFPNGNVAQLFAPTSKKRVVKITTVPVSGTGPSEDVFVIIPSASSNETSAALYKATLYFCPTAREHPRGVNNVRVSDEGVLRISISNASDPFNGNTANELTVQGTVTYSKGEIIWDPTQPRKSTLNVVGGGRNFKTTFTITKANQFFQKLFDLKESRTIKNYTIANFSGSSIDDVRYLQGAFVSEETFGPVTKAFSGATEFRDTAYVAAPGNSILKKFSSYSIEGDTFFDTPPFADPDHDDISCTRTPDVALRMVQGNATLESSLSSCTRARFTNSEFCNNDSTVRTAAMNFPNSCPAKPN